jgi:HSP20 family protein
MFETFSGGPWTLGRLRDEMDRLFANVSGGNWPSVAASLATSGSPFPVMNIWETDQSLCVELEVPGLKLEDVEVLVVGSELTVKGARKDAEPKGDSLYHRRERASGSFSRSVQIPMAIDAGKVEAALKDGILTVSLPKAEAAKPRKVLVKAHQ